MWRMITSEKEEEEKEKEGDSRRMRAGWQAGKVDKKDEQDEELRAAGERTCMRGRTPRG